jgi:hypothetical protein
MKKIIFALIPALLVVAILATLQNNTPGPPETAGQQLASTNGIISMLASSLPVDLALQNRVMAVLTQDAPQRGVFKYAITNISKKSGYLYVSVAGLPMDAEKMSLGASMWLGMVQLSTDPGHPGLVVDLQAPQPPSPTDLINTGTGGAGYLLPFRSGTTAQYGTSGVHNCGFSLNSWKAVDFFPAENMVYTSRPGEINYICRDSTQVALRIGDNLYTHLVDTGQQTGDSYGHGQAISGMVPGTYTGTCGVATQGAQAYHVHFCFLPSASGTFIADGYTLDVATQDWTKGQEVASPLDYLTADWENAGTFTGHRRGGNVWDSTIGGVNSMVHNTVSILPAHVDMGMSNTVMGSAGPAFDLIYTVVLSNFDLTVPLWVLGIIFVLETVRIAYAGWMWVKKAIPIIG